MSGLLLDCLKQSEIRDMSNECDRVGGINLAQGICDFPLNSILEEATELAMKSGMNHYTRYDGEQILREAIAEKSRKYNNIQVDPDRNIVVTCGATGALVCACSALLETGDEVILFEPYYGYHQYTFLSLGLKIKYVPLLSPNWELDISTLRNAISSKTKAIMINTPLNPSGKVFTYEELKYIGQLCEEHNLLVFTDEIYEYILYDGVKHISPASLSEFKNRTITISGYSKTFSITGWRIGYCICPEKYAAKIGYVSDLIYVCAPAPLQVGVASAIRSLQDEYYNNLIETFTYKRKVICNMLTEMELYPFVPQGAYYVMADITRLPGRTGKEKAMWLLDKTGVAVVPGEAFYHTAKYGYNLARFCFAKPDNVLLEACDKIRKIGYN